MLTSIWFLHNWLASLTIVDLQYEYREYLATFKTYLPVTTAFSEVEHWQSACHHQAQTLPNGNDSRENMIRCKKKLRIESLLLQVEQRYHSCIRYTAVLGWPSLLPEGIWRTGLFGNLTSKGLVMSGSLGIQSWLFLLHCCYPADSRCNLESLLCVWKEVAFEAAISFVRAWSWT